MKLARGCLILLFLAGMLLALAACAPAMPQPSQTLPPTEPQAAEATQAPAAEEPRLTQPVHTQVAPAVVTPTRAAPTRPAPTPTAYIENRTVELEWPARLRLGESDVLRLTIAPQGEGYVAQAEFTEHPLLTQDVPLKFPAGYSLYGIARLDGVAFEISPGGDQRRLIAPGEAVTWRWTLSARQPGQQRLSIQLALRWEPEPGSFGPVGESLAFDRSLSVRVVSFMGLTQAQALLAGVAGLFLGGGAGLAAVMSRRPRPAPGVQSAAPNRGLAIEHPAQVGLSPEERELIQAIFARYARVIVDSEFHSGYSGARTFLVRPLYADGRADAATIIKIGGRAAMLQEHRNYETFVKDRLPPVTARIQRLPAAAPGGRIAALQYTFIAEPGRLPRSLRQTLLENPDPAPIQRLFETFGPNWWMQRQPYTFRLAQEYDRLLPPHWLVQPAAFGRAERAGRDDRARHTLGEDPAVPLAPGDLVHLGDFPRRELRPDRTSWALASPPGESGVPLRLRWLAPGPPRPGALAQVTAGRMHLLRQWTASCELFGLPDPLDKLEDWLARTVQGARSTIHGDLNLENALVGPGGLVWLIDFAQTREGHPQFDFAHLAAEIAAHVLAPQCGTPQAFNQRLAAGDPLLQAVETIARRCLFDPAYPAEYWLAQAVTCLGALKFANLTPLSRHCLYLMAAHYAARFGP